MHDQEKTKEQLITELAEMRRLITHLEKINKKLISDSTHSNGEKFKLLYENAPLGYQSLDENGKILDVNETWLKNIASQIN